MTSGSLEDLGAAASAGDRGLAMAVADRLEVRFERDRARERADGALAVALLDRIPVDHPARREVRAFFEAVTAVEDARIALATASIGFVEAGADGAGLLERVEDLVGAEARLEEARAGLETAREHVRSPLPPIPVLDGLGDALVPYGTAATVDGRVTNVGDEPAEEVEVTATAPVPVERRPATIGRLEAGERVEIGLEVGAAAVGPQPLSVAADAATAGDAVEVLVTVLAKREWVVRARRLVEAVEASVGDGPGERGVAGQLRETVRRLERLERAIARERRATEGIDGAIEGTRQRLGATARLLEGDRGGARGRSSLATAGGSVAGSALRTSHLEDARGLLARAVEAAPAG